MPLNCELSHTLKRKFLEYKAANQTHLGST
jgi:hypothetical protein